MEFVVFDKTFDINHQKGWNAFQNAIKLKAEIVRAYGYIDTLAPGISNLRTVINELRQQLAQLAVRFHLNQMILICKSSV